MKKYLLTLLLFFSYIWLSAQDLHLKGEMRLDWSNDSGFYGKMFSIQGEGFINETFSYKFRHRLNKAIVNYNAFDATDLAYIGIKANEKFDFIVGKQTFLQGGWEYDVAPIDSYAPSILCAQLPCYQFGITSNYTFNEGHDKLALQLSNNPYDLLGSNKYALSLAWNGHHGVFHSKYSVNWFDAFHNDNNFMFAFGNKIALGNLSFYLDFISLGAIYDDDPFMNSNTVLQIDYYLNEKINIFAKYSYDQNSGKDAYLTSNGTSLHKLSGGLEFYPIGESLRVHAILLYNDGQWMLNSDTFHYSGFAFNVGITCRLNLQIKK